jgi:2-(1,2-epoxy-1,2-dihydrophenyl)acetyl-CoA isomerase
MVRVERGEIFSIVTLNRPDALNAMSVELLGALVAALREVANDRAVVLRGAGRAFCVGEDLKATLAPHTGGVEELRRSFELLQDLTRLLTSMPAPVVAAVQGYAVGGGAELALAADLVILQDGARLRFPEVPIGHAHTGGISVRLPHLVGLMRAKELLLSGRWVECDEAVSLGLALECVADAGARAEQIATQLAGQPRRSNAAAKRAVEVSTFPNQEGTLQLEVEAATHCFSAAEATDTFEAFRTTKNVAGAR